jgi:lipopolysaccharide/colanic/teichoic acid biosynthesis glycosyltransferase
VFIGDMSFVGPRPERQYFIDMIRKENPNYDYIYLMRPGLTSMATIYNGYTDTLEKMLVRLEMDLEYLQKRSLWYDLKIIVTTALYIITGKKF